MQNISQKLEVLTIGFTEWVSIYKPIKNPYASYGNIHNYKFNTLGNEFEMVLRAHQSNSSSIWTWLNSEDTTDCPNGYILNGSHFCNRSGHLITEIPWPNNVIIEVIIND